MKKIIFLSLFCLIFLGLFNKLFAANNSRTVYGLYTETYDGIVYNSTNTISSPFTDGGYMGFWGDGSGGPDTAAGNFVECQKGLMIVVNASSTTGKTGGMWIQFGYTATDPWDHPVPTDMSNYKGGNLEFWIKTSTDIAIGINDNTYGQHTNYLSTLAGSGVMDGFWHFISSPIASIDTLHTIYYSNIKQPVAFGPRYATTLTDNTTFWVDNVLWVSTNAGTINVTLNNIVDNSTTTMVTWSGLSSVTSSTWSWKVADQYILVDLDYYSPTWGIQIYTNNKGAGAIPQYTGAVGTDPNGLVDTSSTAIAMPMCWSIVNSTVSGSAPTHLVITQSDRQLNSGFYLWMKDINTPTIVGGSTVFMPGEDYVTVWDNRGIQYAEGTFSAPHDPSHFISPSPNFIYLGANFTGAQIPHTYTTNQLYIELFNE